MGSEMCIRDRKKTAVLSNLAKKYELRINLNGNKRGRKANVITKEQEDWLFDVLERSDMTYTNPGRKDHVYMGKINGEKVYEQKKVFTLVVEKCV